MITRDIYKAKYELEKGELVGLPTETVYGLAANAFDEDAIKLIFKLKERPLFNPLIVHIKSIDYLSKIAVDIPDDAMKLANEFWPGPLTLVLKKRSTISDLVTANNSTVAVRIPDHPIALELLNQLDFPLAAPSANPFTAISPTSAEHVHDYFGNKLNVILDGGRCKKGIESTIVGFENEKPVIYRQGSLSIDVLRECIADIEIKESSPKILAPGMLKKHYSPSKAMYLTNNVVSLSKSFKNKKIGLLLFDSPQYLENVLVQEILSEKSDLNDAASNLYDAMHRLDKSPADIIIAEMFPATGLGIVINDRLKRASNN